MTAHDRLTAYCDGGSRGNPGRAGCGAAVYDEDGHVVAYDCELVGLFETNNVAEYHGVRLALRLAARAGGGDGTDVVVRADSRLVVNQLSGEWRVKDPRLADLCAEVSSAAAAFRLVRFEWVPRDLNDVADALANEAMDGRKPTRPGPLGGTITVRRGGTVGVVRESLPLAQRTTTHPTVRIEQTAALAARLGIDGTPAQVAARLRDEAPDELRLIHDTLPGVAWLAGRILAMPLAWRRGWADGMGARHPSGWG